MCHVYIVKNYYSMWYFNVTLGMFESKINHIAIVNSPKREMFSVTVILIRYSMSTHTLSGFDILVSFLCIRSKPLKFLSFH